MRGILDLYFLPGHDICEVDPGGLHANRNLSLAWPRVLRFLNLQHLGATAPGNDDLFQGLALLSTSFQI